MSRRVGGLTARNRKTPSEGKIDGSARDPKKAARVRQNPKAVDRKFGGDENTTAMDSSRETTRQLFPVPDVLDEYPIPSPPSTKKREVLKGVNFTHIDDCALKIPLEVVKDAEKFTKYFTKHAQNDLHKLRGIFRWLTSQRPWSLFVLDSHYSCDPMSPAGLLVTIKQRKYTFAEVFTVLCRHAGIPCVVIPGIAKGVRYEVGSKIDPDRMSSKWTAVCVDDNWRLVHPLWASDVSKGYHAGCWATVETNANREDRDSDVIRTSSLSAINEFYFLTDPEEFISKCFPFDEDWQLLQQNVTMEIFEKSLNLQPAFHELGLEVIGQKSCTLQADQGETKVKLALPGESINNLRFTYNLFMLRDFSDEGEYSYVFSDSFVFFHYSSDGVVGFDLSLTIPGTFKLELHCQDPDRELTSDWICDFRIVCKSPVIGWEPLPVVPTIGWGPGPEVYDVGLTALTHTKALIVVENDELITVKLVMSKKIELKHEVFNRHMQKSETEKLIISDTYGKEYRMQVSVPQDGKYALRIFTKDQKRAKKSRNICNYLIVKRKPEIPEYILTMDRELSAAMENEDVEALSSVIDNFAEAGRTDNKELESAKIKCVFLRLRQVLEYAINSRDLEVLERTVTDAFDQSVRAELRDLIEEAETLRTRLRRMKRLRRDILEMDQKTISELRSYSRPPPAVHAIMMATFLLLGYPEKELKKWTRIQTLIAKQGKEGLKRKVAAFGSVKLSKESLQRVQELLAEYHLDTVQEASHGAATFHLWATHTVSEIEAGKALRSEDPSSQTPSVVLKEKISWKS